MQNQPLPNLFIYSALECEAKPLVKHLNLKKDNFGHPFSIYRNNSTLLTVSGVGKVAMAGAVAYTQAIFKEDQAPVIVNLGIAGHKFHPVGSLFLAEKIVDIDSGRRFYPQLIKHTQTVTGEIQTSSLPSTKYLTNHINDMEASAFYETAIKFSSAELIHSIKVISDNELSSIEAINSKLVSQWINHHLIEIEGLIKHWVSLQRSTHNIELTEFDTIIDQWHFTVSGQIKLKSLLYRWQALSTTPWLGLNKKKLLNSKDLLKKLEEDINRIKLTL